MSPNKLLQFVNCKILRNHKIIEEDLWVRNGKIVNPEKVFFDEKVAANTKINCDGAILAPGFIELQINGKKHYLKAFYINNIYNNRCLWNRLFVQYYKCRGRY